MTDNYILCPHCRKTIGFYGAGRKPKPAIDWAKVDWTKKNAALAPILRVTPSYVSSMRALFAPETVQRMKGRKMTWGKVKWRASDSELAKKYGVSKAAVRMARKSG